ncbi:helix-turn-helix domain-containing protein [Parvimonas sp. G1967]|uniref:helix-turn-helix domain-containing protein n=1 Tax=Parvimonas sp. G1967 TaxID=3387695 RepID=UPI0039E350E6
MTYSEEIKKIRQKCFLSQEAFGREIGVSFSSVNRWECGKSKPNMLAMKKLKSFVKSKTLILNH